MKKFLRLFFIIFLLIFLTLTTQIGGIVFLLSLYISRKWSLQFRYKTAVIFIGLYLFSTFVIVPFIAPFWGREKVKHSEKIHPSNYMTVLMNRNYVKPEMNQMLDQVEQELLNAKISIHYLDANFPFIDKFPLLPHLSHNDGKKLDISLIYETPEGVISNKQKSISGYGVFTNPESNEKNQPQFCKENGYFQYDYPKYLTFGTINNELLFSVQGTKKLMESLLQQPQLEKIFIEPHLKSRMNLVSETIRYHGCGAVRHDDHIHVQIQ